MKSLHRFYYNEDMSLKNSKIKRSRVHKKRSLNLILEFYQKNLNLFDKTCKDGFIVHTINCQQILKQELEEFKRQYNLTPNNHIDGEWFYLILKLESDMREAVTLLIGDNINGKDLTWFRNRCHEEVIAGNDSKNWIVKELNEENRKRKKECLPI